MLRGMYPIGDRGFTPFIVYTALRISMILSVAYLLTVIGLWYYFGKRQNRPGEEIPVQGLDSKKEE